MFQTKVVERKVKTHFTFNIFFFFRKSCRFLDNVERYSRAGQAAGDYDTCDLYAGYLGLRTHSQNM